jgi:hypothetical protein
MAEAGYERFKVEPRPAPHVYPIPYKFDVSAKKLRLAAMLVHEAFEYKLNKEVVLSRPCIYGVFGGRFGGFKPIKQKCVGCMRCVQEYPHIMTVKQSKQYRELGDSYWTPDNVFTIWNEASTGKIPVKGMGYKGSFGGEGFDGIWTDMSEIVRPTRDGVYGREYISTTVDIGRKPEHVDFIKLDTSPTVEIPVPIIFDELPTETSNDSVDASVRIAARKLRTWYISRTEIGDDYSENSLIPILDMKSISEYKSLRPRIVEYEPGKSDVLESLQSKFPSSIIIARILLDENTPQIASDLVRKGVHGLHLIADLHGRDYSKQQRHISDAIKQVHQHLVKTGLRDQITIIASGGIILAEHVPKTIICGADLVGIDTSILVALQSMFEGEARDRDNCMLRSRKIDSEWGAQRLVNLTAVWHDQLIEILSAMGMRDVRRLRGDIGRSILDSETREQSFQGIPWASTTI